ncbi:MAG: NAD(P)H-binding protein [Phycisphaerae bacterium]|jgi:NADH dehydrogenase|nr:NAD(P)H-binding protein [Phycisphaerae bacterium]MCZ2400721.1 NAD(P)H-binding protein [Phycisphaerae bacterium]NUQ48646.1 NAD(P)H-binding protein [Phycisphaerae bacterium]
MSGDSIHVVTGAFGYSGKYITQRLLARGRRVRTLTNSPQRTNPFGAQIDVRPLTFAAARELAESLRGADVLYNTYWVRFNYRGGRLSFTHDTAVENTLRLFEAARAAGVRRVVHVSITNPAEDSPLEYFRGKARLERALRDSGLSHAILRPAVLFGREDILINNIAWVLRRFPVFGVFGDGRYRLQPIHVDDFADLAVAAGEQHENRTIDAIGPETFTYRELVQAIGRIIGKPRPVVSVSPGVGLLIARLTGWLVGDVVVTREEIDGLMSGLLCTGSPPAGRTPLTEWARANASTLGTMYASELARRRNRRSPYAAGVSESVAPAPR